MCIYNADPDSFSVQFLGLADARKSPISFHFLLLSCFISIRVTEEWKGYKNCRRVTRNDFIFPVPSDSTCNAHVRKLIEEAGIVTEQKVTFHTACCKPKITGLCTIEYICRRNSSTGSR